MRKAIKKMATFALRMKQNDVIEGYKEEGYIKRGLRRNYFNDKRGSERAVDMLISKMNQRPYETEYSMPEFDRVKPGNSIKDLTKAKIAIVTSGGIVPKGNPDHIESSSASKYGKYSIKEFNNLSNMDHETAHGGYDPIFANEDADRVVPVDVLRDLEKEGKIGKLHPYFYSTTGNGTAVASAKKFATDIALDLKENKVDAVILTST
jgi:glycine reductase